MESAGFFTFIFSAGEQAEKLLKKVIKMFTFFDRTPLDLL